MHIISANVCILYVLIMYINIVYSYCTHRPYNLNSEATGVGPDSRQESHCQQGDSSGMHRGFVQHPHSS